MSIKEWVWINHGINFFFFEHVNQWFRISVGNSDSEPISRSHREFQMNHFRINRWKITTQNTFYSNQAVTCKILTIAKNIKLISDFRYIKPGQSCDIDASVIFIYICKKKKWKTNTKILLISLSVILNSIRPSVHYGFKQIIRFIENKWRL